MTVKAGTGARERQGEPDPGHFERLCRVIVPGVLTDVCHVDKELAAQVGEDILARAESYAGLDDPTRDVLISPFAEEVVGYEPADVSLELKGAVAVVVRSSLLEEAHSHGPVDAGGIKGITTMAAAPLGARSAAGRSGISTQADGSTRLPARVASVRGGLLAGLELLHDLRHRGSVRARQAPRDPPGREQVLMADGSQLAAAQPDLVRAQ